MTSVRLHKESLCHLTATEISNTKTQYLSGWFTRMLADQT